MCVYLFAPSRGQPLCFSLGIFLFFLFLFIIMFHLAPTPQSLLIIGLKGLTKEACNQSRKQKGGPSLTLLNPEGEKVL